MSLIGPDDTLLRVYWENAQAQPPDEWASARVWQHLWSKHMFTGKNWGVSTERPPESQGRRRVDITIEYVGGDGAVAVLAFHEAKALSAGPRDLDEVERQAYDACMRYLGRHRELSGVYAFTSFGTKGRAWYCSVHDDYLQPLFGDNSLSDQSQYVELHSSDAWKISQAVQTMKNVPPSM